MITRIDLPDSPGAAQQPDGEERAGRSAADHDDGGGVGQGEGAAAALRGAPTGEAAVGR